MYWLTLEKKKELEEELEHLIINERIVVAKNIAKSLKDEPNMSENNDYITAIQKKEKLETRIAHLEDVIRNSVIIDENKKHDKVEVGATVIILKKGDRRQKIFKIVGKEEIDLNLKKISWDSPIAKAMMDKKEGDRFDYKTRSGKINNYLIKKIF